MHKFNHNKTKTPNVNNNVYNMGINSKHSTQGDQMECKYLKFNKYPKNMYQKYVITPEK